MTAMEKLQKRMQKANSLLCVGLDPDVSKSPTQFAQSPTPQFDFNKWIIEQTHELVCAYKPNLAYYEARGPQGLGELLLTTSYLKEKYPDIFLIADAKRGDVDSTSEQYATAIFDTYGFDAVTLAPYIGEDALKPFLVREDKVSIILCKTSNPGSREFQDLSVDGVPLWQHVAKAVVTKWNTQGNCMLVVGATYPEELFAVRGIVGDMPILVPGIGSQGGDLPATLHAGLTSEKKGLLINAARSVIYAENPGAAAQTLSGQINAQRAL